MIVEYKDLKVFSLVYVENESEKKVVLDALVFHSAMSVKSIEVKKVETNKSLVLVSIEPFKKGGSGRFKVDINVSDANEIISFGNEDTKIWPINAK